MKGFLPLSQPQTTIILDPRQPWMLTVVKTACDVWFIKCDSYRALQAELAKIVFANFQKICYCNLEEPEKIHMIEWDGLLRRYSAKTIHKLTEL